MSCDGITAGRNDLNCLSGLGGLKAIYIANYDTSTIRLIGTTIPGTKNNLSWTDTSSLIGNSGVIPITGGERIGIFVKHPSDTYGITPPKLLIDATIFIYLLTE